MASVAATQVLLHNVLSRNHRSTRFSSLQSSTSRSLLLRLRASQTSEEPRKRQKTPPGVDTRIHWDNEDEGWIGGTTSNSKQSKPEDVLDQNFADLLSDFSSSHYEVAPICWQQGEKGIQDRVFVRSLRFGVLASPSAISASSGLLSGGASPVTWPSLIEECS